MAPKVEAISVVFYLIVRSLVDQASEYIVDYRLLDGLSKKSVTAGF